MALQRLNATAENVRKTHALMMTTSAAKGLMEVLQSNLGPKGTIKMLVSGAGDIKMTKDGNVLLHEMQIQHPVASLIARVATSQDDVTGDGTTSCVLLVGELLRQAERPIVEGTHPRIIIEGVELARQRALQFLDTYAVAKQPDKELLTSVARTSLRTKLRDDLADHLTSIVVDGVMTVHTPDMPLDLYMVEIMEMPHKSDTDTRLIKGLVMDHGTRHPDMRKRGDHCFILTCNVSLEYEKSEVNSGFFYGNVGDRMKMAEGERAFIDHRVRKVIELKEKVCDTPDKTFVLINQKGIDPPSLDMLAKAGIIALRRAKRRNMERLVKCCGGNALNSFDDMQPSDLGYADTAYEQTIGEEKYFFVEGVRHPTSCTILIKGPNKHTIAMIKDALRDGLRAVKNAIEDKKVVPGGGAFEIACSNDLHHYATDILKGKSRLGVRAFADALLVIPKTLAANGGHDREECICVLQEENREGNVYGLDVETGEPMDPMVEGVWDNYCVKRQMIVSAADICQQLLQVDEIISAGKAQKGQPQK
jgi:T-complex protein 1 subunit zeta